MADKVGLLGYPVGHSLSPAMHNAAFKALELDWAYDLLPAHPDRLEEKIKEYIEAGYRGFNVTIPHKQTVLDLSMVSSVSRAARTIGAANTLTLQPDGTLHADNTDWNGFIDDLIAHRISIDGLDCVILGTGGSAKAIDYALNGFGAISITFASRNPTEQANIISYEDINKVLGYGDCIINATPVGMSPHIEVSPLPDDFSFARTGILYDLIYNPTPTRLMEQAAQAGVHTVGGLGMLVRQGARSFKQWTGQEPPIDIMMDAARTELKSRST